jgi:hypothetical protein
MARSTGAKARAPRIEPAMMMMPGVDCWLITSQAPTARMADCSIRRSTFDIAPSPPATSLACWLDATYLRLSSLQRCAMRPTMPMAVIASALRRLASISALRAEANWVAVRVGRRVVNSVSTVSVIRMMAPVSAVSPR